MWYLSNNGASVIDYFTLWVGFDKKASLKKKNAFNSRSSLDLL